MSWPLGRKREIAADVASGMLHLAHYNIVHRDLSARNVLLQSRGSRVLAKVADLGLSRQVSPRESLYVSSSSKRPIRWTAPEALEESRFSTASDVWSFGVLYWEILTNGAVPFSQFSELDNAAVVKYVLGGGKLPRPEGCPDQDSALIMACMVMEPDRRPTFNFIYGAIEAAIRSGDANVFVTSGTESYEMLPMTTPTSRSELLL